MEINGAQRAQRGSFAPTPSGFRRLTPGLLQADRTAENFAGLPNGVTTPGQLLAAFKAAASRLGLSRYLVHVVDWLFRFTQPQDWGRGGRPIVWPSASLQQEALGLSATRVKAINRALIEAGLITMKDSPNGKRYGHRDPRGQIVEAYGFDLSPIAARHAEFVRLAEEAREERELMGRLRRRATIARKGIAQILETAAEYGFQGEEWSQLACDTPGLAIVLKRPESPEVMALGVESLERRQKAARERLEGLLKVVDSDPLGAENGPHQYTYKPTPNPEQDTVIAPEPCSEPAGQAIGSSPAPVRQEPVEKGRMLKLHPDELVHLAPRLMPYLRQPNPTWPELVDAADWLRHDLDVSKPLWGEACLAMGREQAAIALAVVSTKNPAHFRTTPGGYFHGMVTKAKAGELNLDRTLWAMRRAAQPKPRSEAAGENSGRRSPGRPWT
jgi:replication initiation protein RepC